MPVYASKHEMYETYFQSPLNILKLKFAPKRKEFILSKKLLFFAHRSEISCKYSSSESQTKICHEVNKTTGESIKTDMGANKTSQWAKKTLEKFS